MPIQPYLFSPGEIPLLVSIPHAGREVPGALAPRLTPAARPLPDTDWHVDKLYDFLGDLGASVLAATHSRYVVDLNRPESDESLYPGQTTTGLFPDTTFAGDPVWTTPPTEAERAEIVETVWRPYHRRIRIELDRLVEAHGFACLWDAHSIAPALPRLFAGTLPDLNLGSFDGAACPPAVSGPVLAVAQAGAAQAGAQAAAGGALTSILDGRFKGGYITRRYGRPDTRIYALQMEIAQSAYMVDGSWQGPDPSLDFAKAEALRPVLRGMMTTFLSAAADHAESLA